MSPTLLMQHIAEHWIATQASDGALPYGFDFLTDKPLQIERSGWTSIVRQAGSFYCLAEYYRFTRDPALQEPLRRALQAMRERSLPIGKHWLQSWLESTRLLSMPVGRWKLNTALDRAGLLYQPSGAAAVISPDGRYEGAETGALALAIVTEMAYEEASGDAQFTDVRAAWLTGLMDLHIPGGGFRQRPATIDDGDYPNGEGWYALALYSDTHPGDERVASILRDVDSALMARYAAQPSYPFLHWGQLAAAQRLASTGDPRFRVFLQQQTDLFLDRFIHKLQADWNLCADMEGMASALVALTRAGEGKTERATRMRAWLRSQAANLPGMQIQVGQTRLPLGGDAYLDAPRMAQFSGGFLLGLHTPTVRVDASAHCLSAMLIIERDRLLAP